MTAVVRKLGYRRHLFGPGDLLTPPLSVSSPGPFPERKPIRCPGTDLQ